MRMIRSSAAVGTAFLLAVAGAASAQGEAYWRFEEAGGDTVLDMGPDGLDGTLNALPFRSSDVAVDPVSVNNLPNTQSLDLNWQSTSSGGFFEAPDTTGG